MVKINYNYDKKEFTQLFRKWYKRTLKGNCIRIYFLLLFLILGYVTYKAGNELLYTSQGKIQKSILIVMSIPYLIVFLLFLLFLFYNYIVAYRCWKRTNFMKEILGTYIESISFYDTYVVFEETVLHEKIQKNFNYSDIQKITICKNGIIFFLEKAPLFICQKSFSVQEEYDIVCKWIKDRTA